MKYKEYDADLTALERLDRWELEHDSQDVRGWPLLSSSGERIGTIQEMLVDRDRERVAAIRLDDGRALPVEPLEIRGDVVILHAPAAAEERSALESSETERIPIVEEELVVGKREVDRGGLRVRKRIVEEPVSEDVCLRTEHVTVERTTQSRSVENPGRLLTEKTIEFSERAEEPVVGKKAFVTEEVVVRKEVDDRVEHVSDTVRKTEVDVEKMEGSH